MKAPNLVGPLGIGFSSGFFHLNSDSLYDEYVLEVKMVDGPTPQVFKLNTSSSGNVFNLDYSLRRSDGSSVRPGKGKYFRVGFENQPVEVPASPDGKFRVRFPDRGEYFLWLVLDDLENPPYEENPGKG